MGGKGDRFAGQARRHPFYRHASEDAQREDHAPLAKRVGQQRGSERRYNHVGGFRDNRQAEGTGRSLGRRRISGLRLDLALFPHLLHEGFDRHLKLVPEQLDERIFATGSFGSGLEHGHAIAERWRFQSVGFHLKLRRFISAGAQSRDQSENLIALLGRGLEKLHSHPEFGMRNHYEASSAYFEVGGLDFKEDTRAPRKG